MSHDITTQLVMQTVDAYERSVKESVAHWNKRWHHQPPLLVKWLKSLPAEASLLDLGCGVGKDAGDLGQRGYLVVSVDRASALRSAGPRRYPSLPLIRTDLRNLPFQTTVVRWSLGCRLVDASSETGRSPHSGRSVQACPSRRPLRSDGDSWREEAAL